MKRPEQPCFGRSTLNLAYRGMTTLILESSQKALSIAPAHTMDYAGRQILLFYFEGLSAHEEKLRSAWDEETLHDMRVATRRLRVACRLLRTTFHPDQLGLFNNWLRELGEVLGAVRDLDVFILFVDEYSRTHGLSAGLEALRASVETNREGARATLNQYLGDEPHRRFKTEFIDWLHGEVAQAAPPRKAGQRLVQEVAPILLSKGRATTCASRSSVAEQPAPEALHNLRIACKRFRYTAEFFKSCYGKRLTGLIHQVTEFQDSLGRYQDAHVHITYLNSFITRLDRRSSRQRRVQADLEQVVSSERLLQRTAYEQFIASWPEDDHPFSSIDFTLKPLSRD